MQKPGFWSLCGAYVVDFIIAQIGGAIAGGVLSFFVGLILGASGIINPANMSSVTVIFFLIGALAGLLVFIFYFAFCESRWGSSLGKKIFKISVVKNQ